MDAGILIQWYHGLMALGGLLGVFATYHRMWVAPEQKRREAVAQRLQELEKEQALQKQRLDSGNKRFDEILAAIDKLRIELKADHTLLDDRLRALEKTVAASVWRGVGEPK